MGENFFVNVIKLKIWGRGDDPASCEWMVTAIGAACKRGKGGCDYRQKRRGPREGSRGKGTQKEKTLHWSWPWSRHEAGHAREAAPDSRKGRKMGFSSEPPDSTHSQLKQEEKRETIYLFPSKVEAPSPGALDCASSQGLGNRNRITDAVGGGYEWDEWPPFLASAFSSDAFFPSSSELEIWCWESACVSSPSPEATEVVCLAPSLERDQSLSSQSRRDQGEALKLSLCSKTLHFTSGPQEKGVPAPRPPVLTFPEGSSWDRCFTRVL